MQSLGVEDVAAECEALKAPTKSEGEGSKYRALELLMERSNPERESEMQRSVINRSNDSFKAELQEDKYNP